MLFFVIIQGIGLVLDLIASYGLNVVQAYMKHIQDNAEVAVRQLLKQVAQDRAEECGTDVVLYGEDRMDDGSKIQLAVKIGHEHVSIYPYMNIYICVSIFTLSYICQDLYLHLCIQQHVVM